MKGHWSMYVLASVGALVMGCRSHEPIQSQAVETVQAHVVQSRQQSIGASVRTTGNVHARETAVISAQVVGRIQQVLVHEGDLVRAGQPLITVDDSTARAASEQADAGVMAAENQQAAAQSNADLAQSTLARYKQLKLQNSVSPQEFDEVTRRAEASAAQVDALRAQVAAAKAQQTGSRAMLGYTRIVAPFAGIVTARMADPGTMAAPGIPLLQMEKQGPLQLQTTIDESAIGAVHPGMKMPVAFDGISSSEPATGTVAEIVPSADPASHTFLVKIDLPSSKQLRSGMYGSVELPGGSRNAILVPQSAVVLRGSLPCAYVLNDQSIAQLRYLTLGNKHNNQVEVLSGISAGERLVDDPADRDLAGKRIEVQP